MTLSRLARFLFCWIAVASCTGKDKSIDIYSYQVEDPIEKQEILSQYLTNKSGLIDAEYHIWYQDNASGLVPGPSDYHIKLALKITPDSLINWTKGLRSSGQIPSTTYWKDLNLNPNLWKLNATPEYFFAETMNEVKMMYREQGIVLAVYSSMPINLDAK